MARKSDGEIWISANIDSKNAQKGLDKLQAEMEKTQEEITELNQKAEETEKKSVFSAAELDAEKRKLQEMKADLEALRRIAKDTTLNADIRAEAKAAIPDAAQNISEQAQRVRGLQSEYNKIAAQAERYAEQLSKAESTLEKQKIRAGELAQQITMSKNGFAAFSPAIEKANKSMDKMSRRVKEVVKSALLFSVITKGLNAIKDWAKSVVLANEEARASIARLKGALLTFAQPLVEVIIPAFISFANVLTRVVTLAATLFAKLFGSTIKQSAEAAENLNAEAKAIEGVGKAAKSSQSSLAGFDEINQISTTESGGTAEPDFTFMDAMNQRMSEMEIYMSGALLALGAILTFSGVNIPLGLGLMAIGAVGLGAALAVDWNAMPENLKVAIGNTLTALGGAALVIGAILTFTGANLPLGIGLMIAGAAAMGTAAALNWNAVKEALQGPLGAVTALAGATFLALGVLIAFSGNLGVGIGMMLAGAAALGITAALNWNAIIEALQGPLGAVVAAISGMLLVLGLVLAFSGVNLALGIALIAAGAVGLATTTALNWTTIKEALQGPIGGAVALVSGALLVIGLILALSGFGLPLGIALIAAGAAGLVTVTALNWNAILEKLKGAWGGIKNWWNTSVKKYFTLEFWKEKFSSISEGFSAKIKDGINSAIALLNRFIDWVNDKLHISWDALTIAGKQIIPAGDVQLLKLPNIPYLAQGAVIPPNREFLAVLGDQRSGNNIEAPEDLIRKIVREEAGGMNSELLEEILAALKARQVLRVNKRVLAQVAAEGINDMTRQSGESILLW